MTNLTLTTLIKKSLETNKNTISEIAKRDSSSYIHALDNLSDNVKDNLSKSIEGEPLFCCTFIKISPVKIKPSHVFGSHIKSEFLNQISICPSKLSEDGLLVPDEDNIILKAMITESSLSDATFNTISFAGTPITYTEFNGSLLPKYKPYQTMKEHYAQDMNEKRQDIKSLIDEMIKEATLLQSKDTDLTKSSKAKLLKFAHSLEIQLRDDINCDLEKIRESLESDFNHIKTEAISSINGYLKNIASEQALGITDSTNTENKSIIKQFFEFYHDRNIKSSILEIISLLNQEELSVDEKSFIEKKILSLTKLTSESIRNQFTINKGSIKIGKPSGSGKFMFGDSRQTSGFISFDFSFGCEPLTYDNLVENEGKHILKIKMTNNQFMELLQSNMTNNWTKCTSQRYLLEQVPQREKLSAKEDPISQIEITTSSLTKELKLKVERYISLCTSTSKSQKTRSMLLESIKEIEMLVDNAVSEDEDILNDASKELLELIKVDSNKKILGLIEIAENKLPATSNLLNHIL